MSFESSTQLTPLRRHVLPLLIVSVIFILFSYSENSHSRVKNTNGGVLDFNLYPYLSDASNDSVFTVNAFVKLNKGWSYFSLTNVYNQAASSELEETASYYSEQNVRWKIKDSSFDATAQFNFRSGEDNDRYRFGIRWRLNDSAWLKPAFDALLLAWSINFHAVQIDHTDASEWQLEHAFRLTAPYISERLYLAGFIDHTFGEDLPENYPSAPIVSEIQLGFRIVENLHIITEYRINQYRREDINNVAVGLQYKMLW